jgi:hypothetical protein
LFGHWKEWIWDVVAVGFAGALFLVAGAASGKLDWLTVAIALFVPIVLGSVFVGVYFYERLQGHGSREPVEVIEDVEPPFQLEGIAFAWMAVGAIVVTLVPGTLFLWFTHTGVWAYGVLATAGVLNVAALAYVYRSAGKPLF